MLQCIHVALMQRGVPKPPVAPVVTEKAVCNDQRRLTACGCLGAAKKQQARMGTVNNGCLWPLLQSAVDPATLQLP